MKNMEACSSLQKKKKQKPGLLLQPEALYLYGYSIETGALFLLFIRKMLAGASENHLILTANAYETGLNDRHLP